MAKKKGTRTRAEAKKLMWEYYRDNKASLPTWIVELREDVLSSIVKNQDVEKAFQELIHKAQLAMQTAQSDCG